MADTLTRTRLRQLADVAPERGRVLSVYFNLDPAEFATPPARASAISSLLNDAQHKVEEVDDDLPHDDRMALRADVDAVREVLQRPDIADEGTRAVAVFACRPAGLLETVRVKRSLDSQVVIDETPYVEPLVQATADGLWCVLLANRRAARIFTGTSEQLDETDRVADNVHSQHRQGGWSQARYQRSVEEEVRDHLAHTAAVVFRLFKRLGFAQLLIGAPEETLGDLERSLHPYLRERLAGHVRIDVENSSAADVRAEAARAIEAHEQARERELLDRLEQGLGAGGRAAAGVDEVLRLLEERRVDTLLLGEDLRASGGVAERATELALDSSAGVVVVRHHDLGPHDGIAALLRY
jgi:peptide subunit release factor 1 (eRF1)